jgi:hypothetical protein
MVRLLGWGERVSRQLITEYRSDLDRIHAASGSKRESVVREAFKDLLKRWGARAGSLRLLRFGPVTANIRNFRRDRHTPPLADARALRAQLWQLPTPAAHTRDTMNFVNFPWAKSYFVRGSSLGST